MKVLMSVVVVVVLVAFTASTALAGGDQNRGDKGKGAVNQNQVRNN